MDTVIKGQGQRSKVKVKVCCLTFVTKQAQLVSDMAQANCVDSSKSLEVERATSRFENAAQTTAPQD